MTVSDFFLRVFFQNKIVQGFLICSTFIYISSKTKTLLGHYSGSQSCGIPNLTPFDPKVMATLETLPVLKPLHCQFQNFSKYPHLFDSMSYPYPKLAPAVTEDEFEEFEIESCYYQTVAREDDDDDLITIDEKEIDANLYGETQISSKHDIILVSCYRSLVDERDTDGNETIIKLTLKRQSLDVHVFPKEAKLDYKTSNSSGEKLNVVVLGMDGVSRMGFQRDFPQSYQWLISREAFEMTGYHKIGDDSFPNVASMLTNRKANAESSLACEKNGTFDKCPFIWKKYAKTGYKTLYAVDSLNSTFNLDKNGFKKTPTHFYLRPGLIAAKKIAHKTINTDAGCFGPRPAFQMLVDYMKKCAEDLESKKENYFFFGWSSSVTSGPVNGGILIDNDLKESLLWWAKKGYLDNTILILTSSHGPRSGVVHATYQGLLEDRLPFLFILVPPTFKQKFPREYRNLQDNRNKLTTPLDVFQTLDNILTLSETGREPEKETRKKSEYTQGISLFQRIPRQRSCLDAGVEQGYCTCNHKIKDVPVSDPLVQQAVHFAVYSINKVVLENKKCAFHNLERIDAAGVIEFEGITKGIDIWKGYQVSFTTSPESSSFKALVHLKRDDKGGKGFKWSFPGDVERTGEVFDNQTSCVSQAQIKKYCFCAELIQHNWDIKFA